MNKGKKWETLSELDGGPKGIRSKETPPHTEFRVDDVIRVLLKNRGLKTKKEIETFLNPKVEEVTIASVGINQKAVEKTIDRLKKAKARNEGVVIFGDYDVDGITGTGIMWEVLYGLGFNVIPYIPHRVEEGYGLSQKGIENVLSEKPDTKVIITVDNGIVANDAVALAKKKGIDVVISDHHTPPDGGGRKLPDAYAIVHTTQLCGSGVAYLLSQEIRNAYRKNGEAETGGRAGRRSGEPVRHDSQSLQPIKKGYQELPQDHLALVALATVADLVPLQNANRALLVEGLKVLRNTNRPGIRALCEEAQIRPEEISVYSIGHVIGPRLNAMGRMESAMDSLRLLCTKDRLKAKVYADKLGRTNKERQVLTQTLSEHAKTFVRDGESIKNILIVANDSYEEGVIGLIAGKLVEEFYRPAIVIAKGEKVSKASARSVNGFNIIDFIRSASHLLLNAGGHPMAAGFSIETEKVAMLQQYLENVAEKELDDGLLQRVVKIDCGIPLEMVSNELYEKIQTLGPFGMGNPEPVFRSSAKITDVRTVGQDGKHLKLKVSPAKSQGALDAIGFGMGEYQSQLKSGDTVDVAYVIDMNVWNGKKSLQLKVRDLKIIQ